MSSDIEDAIKESFKRVKEHIHALEAEIKANREFIISQNQQIKAQNTKIKALLDQINSQKCSKTPKMAHKSPSLLKKSLLENKNSIRNNRVQSINHSTINQSLNNHSLDIMRFKEDLPFILERVSRQEFMTFLMIYQLEEQIGRVSYDSVATGLNLTTSCVRSYVSQLIKKGLPVVKSRYNNRVTILSIPPEIRGLNMKKQLIQMFYELDPNQKKLFDEF